MDRPTKEEFTITGGDFDCSCFAESAYLEALERYIDHLESVNSYLDNVNKEAFEFISRIIEDL